MSPELRAIWIALRQLEHALANDKGLKELLPFTEGSTLTLAITVKKTIDNLEKESNEHLC